MSDELILVNMNDEETGHQEKLEAHRTASLHRAFSVFSGVFEALFSAVQLYAGGVLSKKLQPRDSGAARTVEARSGRGHAADR